LKAKGHLSVTNFRERDSSNFVASHNRYATLSIDISGLPKIQVANTWTEFPAQHVYAMVTKGTECKNPSKSLVAATFEKAIVYVFAGSPIRNAEVRSSTLLCSTIKSTTYVGERRARRFSWPKLGDADNYVARASPPAGFVSGLIDNFQFDVTRFVQGLWWRGHC